jgi:type II secretory pathway component GspD/PulD (secretin)
LKGASALTGPQTGTTLRIATHSRTNSILVQGGREDIEEVESIIMRLDVQSKDTKKPRAEE